MASAPPSAPQDPSPVVSPFDPVAEMLIAAYLDTARFSHNFRAEHELPPSQMTKAHHVRSVMQARLVRDDAFELDERYREMGRVEFLHRALDRRFLLRSSAALKWEAKQYSNPLFDTSEYVSSDVALLVPEFGPSELTLSQAGTKQKKDTIKLIATGALTPIGVWPYVPVASSPFDQGAEVDPFRELGDINLDGDQDDQSSSG